MRKSLLPILAVLLASPARAAADGPYQYWTDNITVTITGYDGPGGSVVIPGSIYVPAVTNFLPVTTLDGGAIGGYYHGAFADCTNVTSVTIPSSVTYISEDVFLGCTALTNVVIPNSVTHIGEYAFFYCTSLPAVTIPTNLTSIAGSLFDYCTNLTRVSIPSSVTTIEPLAFQRCYSLTNVTIPTSVTTMGGGAFRYCYGLTAAHFEGNAPATLLGPGSGDVFLDSTNATVYYLPAKTGWGTSFGGRPTAVWQPKMLAADARSGLQNNQFGFNIRWATGQLVVVEACTASLNPAWQPISTNLMTASLYRFSDPYWTNYPARFYRLRYP